MKKQDITVIDDSEPLITNNTSIQNEGNPTNTQVESKANEPSMLTLAREGFNGYTAAQISTTILVAGTGIMVVNSIVHSLTNSNSSDDANYNTALDWLSGIAGVLATAVTSYGYLRTEAWRIRAKTKLENTSKVASEIQANLETEISSLKEKLAESTRLFEEMQMRAELAEARAKKAESQISSSSQLKTEKK